jgi:hypothetical protein
LKEAHRLRVFVNRGARRLFRSNRNGVTWEWGKLYSEELNDMYSSFIVLVIK